MDTKLKEFVVKKTNELIAAPSCSQEAKAAAQAWLHALGTAEEKKQTQAYVAELEADIVTIDGLIQFAESPAGVSVLGADIAPKVAAHAREIKAAGAIYCDCPACAAVAAILAKKEALLA